MQAFSSADSEGFLEDFGCSASHTPQEDKPQQEAPLSPRDEDRLSTIPEESEATEDAFFSTEDVFLTEMVKEANKFSNILSDDLPTKPETSHTDSNPEATYLPVLTHEELSVPSDYHLVAANVRCGNAPRPCQDTDDEVLEIYYENSMHKVLQLDPEDRVEPASGEYVVERVYKSSSKHKNKAKKKAVVQRADHDLSSEETKQHWPEVIAAMKKELETWIKMGCISRKSRKEARNIIDCRWVLKWKEDAQTKDASDVSAETIKKWIIRARLCLRGFKDIDAKDLDSYAGTAHRYAQRMLVSEAVLRKWDLGTTDISKAFLQGVTYKELAEATGEPLREVNFTLPSYAVALLKQIPGWEDFDPTTEVIHCEKPGTGCNDAPRCFSIKLAKVTRDICGMIPCTADNELCMLHKPCPSHQKDGKGTMRLVAVMTKHVDDLKVTGEKSVIIWILEQIQKVFGQLKIEWNNFTNCGVRHRQDPVSKTVTLDQDDYIKGIKLCVSSELTGKGSEELCGTELHAQYWSVLGAIAYAILTRCDIAVFVAALQRKSQSPQIIHAKRLNAVVRWAQRNPKVLSSVLWMIATDPKGLLSPLTCVKSVTLPSKRKKTVATACAAQFTCVALATKRQILQGPEKVTSWNVCLDSNVE